MLHFSTCSDGSCILSVYVCDWRIDCPDESDEFHCEVFDIILMSSDYYCFNIWNNGDVCFETHNVSTRPYTPTQFEQYSYDYITIPDNSSIPCLEGRSLCTHYRTECFLRHKRCIFERDLFGEPVHCVDTEHLTYCEHYECPAMFKCVNSYCIPLHMICDDINDCPDSEDESFCGELVATGILHCRHDNIYVAPYNVCDNITHCILSNDDEMFCENFICPLQCHCKGYAIMCNNISFSNISNQLTSSVTLLYYINSNTMMYFRKDFGSMKLLDLTNSSFQNGIVPSNYFQNLRELRVLILSNTYINALGNGLFIGLTKVQHLKIPHNTIQKISQRSFHGLRELRTLDIYDIKLKHIAPDSFYDLKKLVTLNVSHNKLNYLVRNAFRILKNQCKAKVHLQYLDLRFNDIDEVDNDIFKCIPSVIIHIDHRNNLLGCFFPNRTHKATVRSQHCNAIISSASVALVFWFSAIFLVFHSVTSIWLQFTSVGLHPKFAVIADIFCNDLIVVLQLLLALVSHSIFQHNYPFVVKNISKYLVCQLYAALVILAQLTPNQNRILIAALYYRVTVYAMVKQPYEFRQFASIIALMKVASIVVAATWVYHIDEYNSFFCIPFRFPQTWSTSPSFSVIASALLISLNIIVLAVTIVSYAIIVKHVASHTRSLNMANTRHRTHTLLKTLALDSILQLCSVSMGSSLIVLTSQNNDTYSILFVAHALCNAVINTINYNKKHLPILQQHVQDKLNRSSKELLVVLMIRKTYAYASEAAYQQHSRKRLAKALPTLVVIITVVVMVYFIVDVSI